MIGQTGKSHTVKNYLRWFLAQIGLINKGAYKLGINTIYPDDLFILSFPKSGNTWIRFLLATVKSGGEMVTLQNVNQYVQDVYSSKALINQLKEKRLIKVHHQLIDYFPKTVYVVRDYRDTIVSNYYRYTRMKGYTCSFSEFYLSGVCEKPFGTWQNHVEKALAFKKKHSERICFLRYEDLLVNPRPLVEELLDFCNITPTIPVEKAIELCSFSNLQQRESVYKGNYARKTGEFFFRKGKTGQWQEYFTENDLRHLKQNKSLVDLMQKLGYTF